MAEIEPAINSICVDRCCFGAIGNVAGGLQPISTTMLHCRMGVKQDGIDEQLVSFNIEL